MVRTSNELPYINNSAQRPDSIGPVNDVCAAASILHNGTCDHDDILGGVSQLFDDKVDHLSQAGIFVLEELRDAKEQGGSFVGRELLARVEEEGDFGKENSTFSRLYGRAIKQTRWTGEVNIVRASSRARDLRAAADLLGRPVSGRPSPSRCRHLRLSCRSSCWAKFDNRIRQKESKKTGVCQWGLQAIRGSASSRRRAREGTGRRRQLDQLAGFRVDLVLIGQGHLKGGRGFGTSGRLCQPRTAGARPQPWCLLTVPKEGGPQSVALAGVT